VRKRQRYCSRPTCIKASRGAAQKRWLRKAANRDHFKGDVNQLRVQDWRSLNPGYWRKKTRLGRYILRGKLAETVREFALQDMIDAQFLLLAGLVSHLTGVALQDEIASEIRRLILLGHGILNETAQAPAASRESGQRP
jgi:hypothetical protein